MTTIGIAPIVEGHGEVQAVRILLARIFEAFGIDCGHRVLTPIRVSRSRVVRNDLELIRAIDLAALKLRAGTEDRKLVLLLLDADEDPACELAPRLLDVVRRDRAHLDVACVLPVIEYETWLIAGAATLGRFLTAGFREQIPEDVEAGRVGKGWIQHFFAGPKYSPAVDQARLTASFDVRDARLRSRSFDKLCREIEGRSTPRLET